MHYTTEWGYLSGTGSSLIVNSYHIHDIAAKKQKNYLIEPALPLPGTRLVQALEGGVPKLVLYCLVSETVDHNVLLIAG